MDKASGPFSRTAFDLYAEGNSEEAMRYAIAEIGSGPRQLEAAFVLAREISKEGRTFTAADVFTHLVDAWSRRGHLPAAVVAAAEAEALAEDGDALRKRIADVFGKGSNFLSNVSLIPPAISRLKGIPSEITKLSGDALVDRAESALHAFLAENDPIPADQKIPELPLFAALAPNLLSKLLAAMRVVTLEPESIVIQQGEEGSEAYIIVRGELEVVRHNDEGETTLATLGPQAIFGEMALVSEAPRTATVQTICATELLVINRDTISLLSKDDSTIATELGVFCRKRMVENLMRHSDMLSKLSHEDRMRLIKLFVTKTFPKNKRLIEEGKQTTSLFLIASGQVEVTKREKDGETLRITTLGPGSVVGEISMVLRRVATASVVATHTTVALELSTEAFRKAINDYPALLVELYHMAIERDDETQSVMAQNATQIDDIIL